MRRFGLVFIAAIALLWSIPLRSLIFARFSSDAPPAISLELETAARTVPAEFYDLAEINFPAAFAEHIGAATEANFQSALARGRAVYLREGCQNCHTQIVRNVPNDIERWGAPSGPYGHEVQNIPRPVIGARRVGPDLARLSNRYSNDWHAAHLYSPRALLPDSVMPAYPWLFEQREGRMQPNRNGLALIIYLQSLGSEIPEDRR